MFVHPYNGNVCGLLQVSKKKPPYSEAFMNNATTTTLSLYPSKEFIFLGVAHRQIFIHKAVNLVLFCLI